MSDRVRAAHGVPKIVDPLVADLPMFTQRYDAQESPMHGLRAIADTLIRTDAIVIASAEYNHAIPPALANLLDYFRDEFAHKPAFIVTYSPGMLGGARVGMALRMMLPECGMPTIPSLLAIPQAHEAIDASGVPRAEWLVDAMDRTLEELGKYAAALAAMRSGGIA